MNNKGLSVVGVIIIVAVVVIVAVGYYYLQGMQPQEQEVVTSADDVGATNNIADIDISGWKTFRNEDYIFEFQYPPSWIDSSEALSDPIPGSIASVSTVDAKERLSKKEMESVQGIQIVTLRNENFKRLPILEYLKQAQIARVNIMDVYSFESYGLIGGVEAVQGRLREDGKIRRINFTKGTDVFTVHLQPTFSQLKSTESKILDKILSTFKFTK